MTVPEDAVVAQGFTPDPKLIQFVSIGVAPAGILAAVAYIMSRNYGSKQIGRFNYCWGNYFTMLEVLFPIL